MGDRYELNVKLTGTVREYELKLPVYLEQLGNRFLLHDGEQLGNKN
jgi:hypothetical protein